MNAPKLLHATRWINLLQKDRWVYASRRLPDAPKKIDAVTIVAMHRDDSTNPLHRLVVIEEFRVSIDKWEFSLPAGLLDLGESIAECGARELKEETGFDVTKIQHTSGETFSSAGLSDESQAFVTVECHGTASLTPGIESELIRVHLLTQQGCLDLLDRNRKGEAAIASRLWPVLMSVAFSGNFAGVRTAP